MTLFILNSEHQHYYYPDSQQANFQLRNSQPSVVFPWLVKPCVNKPSFFPWAMYLFSGILHLWSCFCAQQSFSWMYSLRYGRLYLLASQLSILVCYLSFFIDVSSVTWLLVDHRFSIPWHDVYFEVLHEWKFIFIKGRFVC